MVETFKDDMSVLCPLFVHFSLIFIALVNVTFLVCLSFSTLFNSGFFFSFGILLIKIRSTFVVDYNGRASEGMAGLSDR